MAQEGAGKFHLQTFAQPRTVSLCHNLQLRCKIQAACSLCNTLAHLLLGNSEGSLDSSPLPYYHLRSFWVFSCGGKWHAFSLQQQTRRESKIHCAERESESKLTYSQQKAPLAIGREANVRSLPETGASTTLMTPRNVAACKIMQILQTLQTHKTTR